VAPAWALHKESPPVYRITRGSSHHHPVTRSWGNYFAFSSSDDLVGNGNNRREIFIFNLGFFAMVAYLVAGPDGMRPSADRSARAPAGAAIA